MTTETKVAAAVGLAFAMVLLAIYLSRPVGERLRPEPVAAYLALEAQGEGRAVTGSLEIVAGKTFKLHAVLEARSWNGETIYYTEAPRLLLAGQEVPQQALRRWDRPEEVRILWFSVEGTPPYLELSRPGDPGRLGWREIYRPDWPSAWSIPGSVEGSRERSEGRLAAAGSQLFGTQRYYVRIEIFGPESRIRPRHRLSSPSAQSLPDSSGSFPTATAFIPGPLRLSSRMFGLPQVEPAAELGQESAAWLAELFDRDLAFSRSLLIRSLLAETGAAWEGLNWSLLEINGETPWGEEGVAAGDLLTAGGRLVVLYADRGLAGVLDEGDLCFDYFKGAAVRRLDEVFKGDGLLEWSRL